MTDTYVSENADVLVAIEPSQGETTTPDRRAGFIEEDVSLPDIERDESGAYTVGGGRKAQARFKGQTSFEGGSLTIKPVDALPFEMLLLSEKDGTTNEIIPPNDGNEAISYTVQAIVDGVNENFVRTFSGCVTGSGSINVTNDDELTVTIDFDAVDVSTTATVGSASQGTLDKQPWSFRDTASNLSLFGASFSKLNDFSADIDHGTTIERYVNNSDGGKPSEIILGNLEVSATAEINISDASIYDEILSGSTSFTTSLEFDNTTKVLTIELLECEIPSAPVDIPSEGVVSQEVEIVANDIRITVQ